jgi:hypothetical protein
MAPIARLRTERARFHPDTVFQHPSEIVDEMLLTRGQKLATLKRWRQRLIEKARAKQDGGIAQDDSALAVYSEMMAAIEAAERELAVDAVPA